MNIDKNYLQLPRKELVFEVLGNVDHVDDLQCDLLQALRSWLPPHGRLHCRVAPRSKFVPDGVPTLPQERVFRLVEFKIEYFHRAVDVTAAI